MSMPYDPVAMGAYLDAMGQGMDGVNDYGVTTGGAPAASGVAFNGHANYGASVAGVGTPLAIVGLCALVYLCLHLDRGGHVL